MAARRHTVNPAKVKHHAKTLDDAPPPEVFQRRLELRRRLSVALLCLLSTVLLIVSFPPFDLWFLGYVAMVPWLLALLGGAGRRWALLWAWVAGLVFWAASLYWLWWITLIGYTATVLYLSVYWWLAALLVRYAGERKLPMWLVFPIVWVSLEYLRAYVIGGFPWFFLAHSQWTQVRLIQIADVTGQYGVSFFVAMVCGALTDLLAAPLFVRDKGRPRLTRQIGAGLVASGAAAVLLLVYGTIRLSQDTLSPGPVTGVAQCSFRNTLKGRDEPAYVILRTYLEVAERLEGAECDVVLLPETSLPAGLNRGMVDQDLSQLGGDRLRATAELLGLRKAWQLPEDDMVRRYVERVLDVRPGRETRESLDERASLGEYAASVASASKELGCPVMAGGVSFHYNDAPLYEGDEWRERNSVLMFTPEGPRDKLYSKMHLVPFGEYVPFKDSWLWFHEVLRGFVPSVMRQIEPGDEPLAFELRGRDERTWRLAPVICYEGTFARVCREVVNHARSTGAKNQVVLVNLSNDGWFVYEDSGGVPHASTEHSQHFAVYAFRAIENRVPVVRAVNTGVSGAFDPNGRVVARVPALRTEAFALGAQGEAGQEYMPIDSSGLLVDDRVSVYSRMGDVFAWLVCLAGLGLVGLLIWRRVREGKGQEESQ